MLGPNEEEKLEELISFPDFCERLATVVIKGKFIELLELALQRGWNHKQVAGSDFTVEELMQQIIQADYMQRQGNKALEHYFDNNKVSDAVKRFYIEHIKTLKKK